MLVIHFRFSACSSFNKPLKQNRFFFIISINKHFILWECYLDSS